MCHTRLKSAKTEGTTHNVLKCEEMQTDQATHKKRHCQVAITTLPSKIMPTHVSNDACFRLLSIRNSFLTVENTYHIYGAVFPLCENLSQLASTKRIEVADDTDTDSGHVISLYLYKSFVANWSLRYGGCSL